MSNKELLEEGQDQAPNKAAPKKGKAVKEDTAAETAPVADQAPNKAAPVQEADKQKVWKTKEEETKHKLSSQPKVMFLVPLVPGEKPGAYETVQINGYRLTIKKGVMVSVPQAVANILAEHHNVQLSAGQDKLADRATDVEDALN